MLLILGMNDSNNITVYIIFVIHDFHFVLIVFIEFVHDEKESWIVQRLFGGTIITSHSDL